MADEADDLDRVLADVRDAVRHHQGVLTTTLPEIAERAIPLTREFAALSLWRALRDAGVEEPVESVAGAVTAACRAATQTRV